MASYADPQPVGYYSVVFRVNLETVNRQGHLVPSNTQPIGNETVAEANNFKNTRSTWAPAMLLGNRVLKHGDTFTASGSQAKYLKDLYVKGSVDDMLQVVSIT